MNIDSISDQDLQGTGRQGALLSNLKWAGKRKHEVQEVLTAQLIDIKRNLPHYVQAKFSNPGKEDYALTVTVQDGKFFDAPAAWVSIGPSLIVTKKKKQKLLKFRVPEVEKLSDQLMDVNVEKRSAQLEIIRLLSAEFLKHMPVWRSLLKRIGEIDALISLLRSLAMLSKNVSLPISFPEFVSDDKLLPDQTPVLKIDGAWNPTLAASHVVLANTVKGTMAERPNMEKKIVQNDIQLSEHFGSSCILLTGPNMSGKTTIMRLLGINVILAQIGKDMN